MNALVLLFIATVWLRKISTLPKLYFMLIHVLIAAPSCVSTNKNFIKARVHCFSMKVQMNKCFLLNTEKKLAQICLVIFEKNAKNANFNAEK